MKTKEEQCELIAVDYLESKILLSDALLQAYNTGANDKTRMGKETVLEMVDNIMHCYASDYRIEAKEMVEEAFARQEVEVDKP